MAHVLVIGGGLGGLATALLVARHGHTAELFERDTRAPGTALDRDFFGWRRPSVPQANQPHALLGAARNVLRDELPDVHAEMLRLGARERHEMDWFDVRPPARPGDEDLVMLQARRIVLESALATALRAEPGVVARYGEPVTGLLTAPEGGDGGGRLDGGSGGSGGSGGGSRAAAGVRVTGVTTEAGVYEGDLVVDAGGRRGGAERWLAAVGCRPAVVERHRTGLAYFCRWYRLPEGRAEGPRRPWAVTGGSFAGCAVFPADNRVFAVTLFVHTGDTTRSALRDPEVFERAARAFPPGAAWLDLGAEPLSDVLATGGLDNRWSSLVDERGPVVTGLVPVGDAITHTNPTLGQGTSLTLWAARRVARTAHQDPGSVRFAVEYHGWAVRTLGRYAGCSAAGAPPGRAQASGSPGSTSARSKPTTSSSWAYVQLCGARSGRMRRNCAVCRKRSPSMWSYATSQTHSGRNGTQERSFFPVQRLCAPGSRALSWAASSAQAAHG